MSRESRRHRGSEELAERVLRATGARGFELGSRLQALWGGYGDLWRGELTTEGGVASVIVKDVRPPDDDGSLAHRRKLRSYRVEQSFYARFADRLDDRSRVARALALSSTQGAFLTVLEDLEQAGYSTQARITSSTVASSLEWLAVFHATFLGESPEELWKVGTYWHLGTRPDEHARMRSGPLRARAAALDQRLNAARFRTFVHGDAKPDNVCSARDGSVAFVDFQYVGGGVGVKDVAYLLNCCLSPKEYENVLPRCLDSYFAALRAALEPKLEPNDIVALEREWRELFPVAWVDFYRFLQGWAPGSYDPEPFSEALVRQVLAPTPR
jgi:thiamine kinase-like enzyme